MFETTKYRLLVYNEYKYILTLRLFCHIKKYIGG